MSVDVGTRIVDRIGRVKLERYPCGGYLHVSYTIEAPPYGFPEEFGYGGAHYEIAERETPQKRGVRTRAKRAALAEIEAAEDGE